SDELIDRRTCGVAVHEPAWIAGVVLEPRTLAGKEDSVRAVRVAAEASLVVLGPAAAAWSRIRGKGIDEMPVPEALDEDQVARVWLERRRSVGKRHLGQVGARPLRPEPAAVHSARPVDDDQALRPGRGAAVPEARMHQRQRSKAQAE